MEMQEKVLPDAVLVFLKRDGHIWLARKTKHIGKGLWNGYGGGIEIGETPRETVVREAGEETRPSKHLHGVTIRPADLHFIGIAYFTTITESGERRLCKVRIYMTSIWEGEIWSSEEMIDPTPFRENKLPFQEMMLADRVWLPAALIAQNSGKKIIVRATYGPGQKTLIGEVRVEYVDELSEE